MQPPHSALLELCAPLEWHAASLLEAMQDAVCRLPQSQCPCSQPACSVRTRLAVCINTVAQRPPAHSALVALCAAL